MTPGRLAERRKNPRENSVPRKQVVIFAIITVVAVVAGVFSGVISVYIRAALKHGTLHF